ncbi:hypothetical protein [Sphingobium lignivorans]|uniref:ArsR family transcriptional regulator n=1 Tax=Sphingobium lignivorans TaxID=2735886 RepID=A0ABR6NJF9_9SPHN|nr:hypothetical protein [Sphingobium lignivorans]MBB5987418.1 hypothetical protein [Sphingobium lignivorans]
MSYSDAITADARLCILKELARQVDGRLNEVGLTHVLDAFGIRRPRSWVRTQLLALDQLGAVKVTELGTVMVASLTKLGRDHVERRQIVDGVARPSDED